MAVPGARWVWDKYDQRPDDTTLLEDGTLVYHHATEPIPEAT